MAPTFDTFVPAGSYKLRFSWFSDDGTRSEEYWEDAPDWDSAAVIEVSDDIVGIGAFLGPDETPPGVPEGVRP